MNPYRISPPFVVGESFYGRKLLIRSLLRPDDELIWLVGNRKVGKSSLLRHLQFLSDKSKQFVAIYLEFSATDTISDWTDLLRGAVRRGQSRDALRQAQIDILPLQELDFFGLQRALVSECRQHGRRLLLLCDEVESWMAAAKKDPRLLQRLRKEWTTSDGGLKVIIAGTKRLLQLLELDTSLTSPLLMQFDPRFLAGLNDEEANELIEQAQNPLGKVNVASDVRELIKRYTGNHPFLIQRLCHKLYQENNRALRKITKDDCVVDELLGKCFEIDYESLSPLERRVLLETADHKLKTEKELCARTRLSESALALTLSTLRGLGFIRKHGSKLGVGNFFLWQWLTTQKQDIRQKERSDIMLDPELKSWAIAVLTNASAFLFSEAKEVLKMRRERQQSTSKEPQHVTPQGRATDAKAVPETVDRQQRRAWVERIIEHLDISQREEMIREINTIVQQIKEHERRRRKIEEELAEGEQVGVENVRLKTSLDRELEKIEKKRRKLRMLWEEVCQTGAEPPASS